MYLTLLSASEFGIGVYSQLGESSPEIILFPRGSERQDGPQLRNLLPYEADNIKLTGNNLEVANVLPRDS